MNARPRVVITWSASALILAVLVAGCASRPRVDLQANDPQARGDIERRLQEIFDAAERKDMERLDSYHFYGPKFTKFSESSPDRRDASATRESEHRALTAMEDLKMEAKALKIDVFGHVAIATFILDARFTAGGKIVPSQQRSTLVFVQEGGDWKITHEHFSPIE